MTAAPVGARLSAKEAEEYLMARIAPGVRPGLDRMWPLVERLGHPQRRYETIHVVGTNGKTSTVHMIGAILREHGLRTGTIHSPDLTGFPERVQIDGRRTTDRSFARAVTEVAAAVDAGDFGRATLFEAMTAAAFVDLDAAEVDVAVVEAGLGGRFDATNVLDSRVQVLTSVGFDHTEFLGDSKSAIALEKLAVLPLGGDLVCGRLDSQVEPLAARAAGRMEAHLSLAGRDFQWEGESTVTTSDVPEGYAPLRLRALGDFQRANFACAVRAAERYLGSLEPAAVARAAAAVHVPGRMEIRGHAPLVVFDGAHNADGFAALAGSIRRVVGERPLHACLAIGAGKDRAAMLETLVPHCASAVMTRSRHPRCGDPEQLVFEWKRLSPLPVALESDPHAALAEAKRRAGAGGAVIVSGSLYLLSELLGGFRCP